MLYYQTFIVATVLIGLDDRQSLDGAGHRDIRRVDVELVDLERLVGLVLGEAIVELLAFEIARRQPCGRSGPPDHRR